jgi:hypothetical protein
LANDEVEKLVGLRQIGTSWLKIQHKTGIDRRKAKRAYEKWEQTQSTDELKKARQDVAARAFSEHIDILIKLAEYLICALRVPEALLGFDNADEALDRFWSTDILEPERLSISEPASHEREHVIWRNKLLFKSLKEHTRGAVRWQALDEWKEARDSAIGHSRELQSEAAGIVKNILNSDPDLSDRVIVAIRGGDVTGKISNGLMEAMWRGILTGKGEQVRAIKGTSALTEGQAWLEFYTGDSETRLLLNDVELVKEVLNVCHWADNNLRTGLKSELVQRLTDGVCQMQARARELEESLDELVLRPMILRTRCDLCPA